MPIQSIRIPQMGEGLQEALLVEFLKQPGEMVKRDEAIYVMETDKASTEVESPFSGRLVAWLVKEGTVLPIGTEVAQMEVEGPASTNHSGGHSPSQTTSSSASDRSTGTVLSHASATMSATTKVRATKPNRFVPPRTRAYLKDKGLLDVADEIPCKGTKLTPEDVDHYLATASHAHGSVDRDSADDVASQSTYDERPVPKQQITLNYRLVRSMQTTVPVTVMNEVDWTAMASARQQIKAAGGTETSFYLMLWCVAQALSHHPLFRSSISSDGTVLRTYRDVQFGIAVALPEDMLVTAVVRAPEGMSRDEFFASVNRQIDLARQGVDQADPSITISISNIGTANMRFGIPAIVAPAVATLALGEVFDAPVPDGAGFRFQKRAQLTLAFDHRVINGVGAAAFMNDLKYLIETFSIA